jgi:endonuclease/exonuclease/phosphatase (EEP) superfamily protein YafD
VAGPPEVPDGWDRRATIRAAVVAGIALVPWVWFPARDRTGWVGDLAGVTLPVAWVVAFVVGVAAWRWVRVVRGPEAVAWLTSITVVAALAIAGPRWPDDAGDPVDPIRLAAANVYYRNDTDAAAVRDLLALDADVLVVSEVTDGVLEPLTSAYPYIATDCRDAARCDEEVAVASRYPLRGVVRRPSSRSVLRVLVDAPHPFVLLAAHLPRPSLRPEGPTLVSFAEHRTEIDRLLDAARSESAPVVIAGDLNLSDRTSGYRRLDDEMVDAARTGWAAGTFPFGTIRVLALRIDHLFVTSGWCSDGAATFGVAGSDHRGVAASIGPCDP